MELNLNFYNEAVKDYKKLLANKEKLVGQKTKDGRNQFQVKINELKKSIKGQNFKFSDVKNDTLKQEREGKFDRGAEGKAKNKLRKKMAGAPKEVLTRGRHAGSKVDKILEKGITGSRPPKTSEENVDLSKGLSGETDAERKKRKNKMTKAKIAKSR